MCYSGHRVRWPRILKLRAKADKSYFLSISFRTLFFFIRTSNFDAEAERSYIFWRFEAETFLKMFLNLIKPEGLKSYIVPPPALLEPSVSLPQAEEISVIGEDRVVDEAGPNEQEEQEYNLSESEVMEDKYEDRDFSDKLVGSKVTALYENGWFTGTIEYYNAKLKEYKVNYLDNTSDFVSPDDFDGVEVILEQL